LCAYVLIIGHCFLPALSSPFSPTAYEVDAMILAKFVTIALPDAECEWPIVTMLLGVTQFDASSLLHR
jgi:hypothetical protein